jgi:hypothetical protein
MDGTTAVALIPDPVHRGFQDLLEAEDSALTGAQLLSGDSENWPGGDTKTGPPCGARQQRGHGVRWGAIDGAVGPGDCSPDPSGRQG